MASLLFAGGCSVAAADQLASPTSPRTALAIAPAKVRAPYDVQILRESGDVLPTYAFKDRFYVQGNANERYIIRILNPTPNRIEAVVSVDGLDVVDGENGDLRKRGYVVPPYGETRIEGFRTSSADVATFRFSSVVESYAGKKGKARNVGVVAVALFEEQPGAQIIVPEVVQPQYRPPYDYEGDLDFDSSRPSNRGNRDVAKVDRAPSKSGEAKRSIAPSAPPPSTTGATSSAPRGGSAGAGARRSFGDDGAADMEEYMPAPRQEQQQRGRMGLGTEFGEQRYSAATFTKFVRAAGRPVAIAELRYNDAAGLTALGILATPLPDEGEIMTRETADPFPGDGRFSRAPGR
ncbi:MAG: hypothetical protein H0T46_29845 [Deltaproteobacteria bacterium]|nr:hypothetical protein [Deltaproteobacteria bacterium]